MGHADIVKTLLDVTLLDWPRLFEMASSHSDVLLILEDYRKRAVTPDTAAKAATAAVIGSVRNRELKLQSERDRMEQEAPTIEDQRLNLYRQVTDEELKNSIRVMRRIRARNSLKI
jgi:hypothetical protein